MMVRGERQYMIDDADVQYLDAYNNVAHVGHCHPHVVGAITEQASKIFTNTRYLHPNIVNLAQRLTAKFPAPLSVCFFANSGSEANDLALRLARNYTKNKNVIILDQAYHGTTLACVKASPTKSYGEGSNIAPPHIHKVPVADGYRGAFKNSDVDAGKKYAAYVAEAVASIQARGEGVSAFFAESIQGVGGQVVYVKDYMKEAYKIVHDAGGLCIADEVQTGFGRVGSHYWAFELYDVVPDIVTMGKPFGNGFPLAAVVTTKEIAEAFASMEYFNTFGGNPVAMAAGLAVMDVIEQEKLQQNAASVGEYLQEKARLLMAKHPLIGCVRGAGLFIGVEFVKDQESLTPATRECRFIVEQLKEKYHILTGLDGPGQNVLRIKPPLCFTKENADTLLLALDEILLAMSTSALN